MALRDKFVRVWPLLGLMLGVSGGSILLSGASRQLELAVTTALINLVVVVGLYVFVGNSGIFSFGHISFMAIGAYTSALLTIPPITKELLLSGLPGFISAAELPITAAILVAGGVAALFALAVSLPLARLSGTAASIATLAVLVIVRTVLTNWEAISGGDGTITGVPLETDESRGLIWALLAMVAAFLYQESRFGLLLRASRENEIAARSAGIHVEQQRRIAFVLSAFLMGIGGALYGHFLGSFDPGAFYLQLTFLTIAMLVIGGTGSLAGAVGGVVVVSALVEFFNRLESGGGVGPVDIVPPPGLRDIFVALLMLVILALRPRGITGGRELSWPFGRRSAQPPYEPTGFPGSPSAAQSIRVRGCAAVTQSFGQRRG